MTIGTFARASALTDDGLALGLSPALTPTGIETAPSFFHGFATHPQVLARGLVTLADVTAARYFKYVPSNLRDPILTAHGDRLRAECFSACNGVYARLDLDGAAFDGGEIARGTTNVDIGAATRELLTKVTKTELLHLDVGTNAMTVSTPVGTAQERRVDMPDRWVRALGNAAQAHQAMTVAITAGRTAAQRFLAAVPPASATHKAAWLTVGAAGVRVARRPTAGSIYVGGLHRLSAAKRLLTHIQSVTFYGPGGTEAAPVVVEFGLPAGRLVLGLTPEPWRGYSGEGALLESIAAPTAIDHADLISAVLAFEPIIEVGALSRQAAISEDEVRAALAVLAVSGRVGWDVATGTYFHRELPHDPDRVTADNPRLVAARRLAASGAVTARGQDRFVVASGHSVHEVTLNPATCTCQWHANHGQSRGPCKHVLAAQIQSR